jgi:K+-sensing histidine kinase KdpD
MSSAFSWLSGSLETNWGKQAASGCAVALSTLALLGVDQFLGSSYLMFAYVVPILFVAAKFGRTAALGAALLSSICAAFFLIEPKFSLEIESSEDFVAWLSFCFTALLISQFSGKRYVRGPIL